MTRQDFEKIAGVIRKAPVPSNVRARLAYDMAGALADTNDRFDFDRFLAAATGMVSMAEVRRYRWTRENPS